jgi:8-oxo-dGTP diphosphatase
MNEDIYHLGVKALVKNKEGKYLLLKVNEKSLVANDLGEYWDIPGGRLKKGNTTVDTLKREVFEETGINNIKVIKEIGTSISNIRINLKEGGDVGLILSVYEVEIIGDENITISTEHIEYKFCSVSEVKELLKIKYPASLIDRIQ